MEHIEEGTIHAWLDDALASDEAARVEQHVRECAECAAAVAEARGLIAASTRILSALDEVPGGLVPRRVEGEGTSARAGAPVKAMEVSAEHAKGAGAMRARRRRPWWQRPQFAAAAGIAFVAVALSVVWQRSPQRTVSDVAQESASAPAVAPSTASTPTAAATDAPRSAAPTPGAEASPNASPQATPNAVAGPAAAKGVAPATARESKEAARPLAGGAANVPAQPLSDGARAKRAAANEALADASTRALSEADVASRKAPPSAARAAAPAAPPVTAQKAAPPAPSAVAQQAPTDSLAARRKLALNADNITRAEQARVRGERDVQLEAVVTTGASVAMEARRDFMSAAGIVGCYRLQRRVPALDAGVSEVVELQATERGVLDGDVLRVARLIGVDPRSDTEWRWSLSTRGDVSLVRVQGAAYARFPLALRMAAQTGETSIATRITCPAR